jgi:diacylglycerol kinase
MHKGLPTATDTGYAAHEVQRGAHGPHHSTASGIRMSGLPQVPDSQSSAPRPRFANKFRHAFRGAKRGIRGQSSFFIHIFCAMVVVAGAVALDVSLVEWCLFAVCITMVLAAEMFNTALERLAKAISREHHPDIGTALDISSAAVLLTAIGAAVVGVILFLNRILLLFGWPG